METSPIRWKRRGLVLAPTGTWWMRSHAMMPTPERLEGSLIRLYFSGRDRDNRSHIGWAILDLEDPTQVIDIVSQPVLSPGELGTFDDNGVTPSCLIEVDGQTYLYYVGWNPGSTVRVHLFGGLAVQKSEGFERVSRAPILERTAVDPFLNTAPYVIEVEDELRMYYVAGVGWDHRDLPRYHIKHARSVDGVNWEREHGSIAIDFEDDSETALARPFIVRHDGLYRMWFSTKRGTYSIGYAESHDGIVWHRNDDHGGLRPSESGWDSQMVEYGVVIEHEDQLFMFYNGNDYGQDGFGLATSE